MFFFGIFSTAAPLVLLLVFYLFGIATMTLQQKKVAAEMSMPEAKQISFKENLTKTTEKTYHFSKHVFRNSAVEAKQVSVNPIVYTRENFAPPISPHFIVHDFYSYRFNKPPPYSLVGKFC